MKKSMNDGERRSLEVIKRAQRKLDVLQKWVSEGLPVLGSGQSVWFPRNKSEFARWEDAELGVEKMGESSWRERPNPAKSQGAAKLRIQKAAGEVMVALVKLDRDRGKAGESLARLRSEKAVLKETVEALTSQLHELHHRLTRAELDIEQLSARLEAKSAENAELVKALRDERKLVGIR